MTEKPFTILVVDDQSDVLLMIQDILPDYNIFTALSREAALRVLLREHVNLVLLDMGIDGMDGIKTASMIKGWNETENIPIIFMSDIDKNDYQVLEGYGAGGVDHIFKPFTAGLLRAKISVFNQLFRTTEELKASKAQIMQRAEETLREERDKAREYLNMAGTLLMVLNREGCITLLNRKGYEILGYEEGELLGKDWLTTCVPGRTRDEVIHTFGKLIDGDLESAEYFESPVLTKQGEERIVAWHNTVLRDQAGNVTSSLSSGEDITSRKQAEEQIKNSLREKEILLKEIHHRVKNNLNVIVSLLSLQSDRIENKEQALAAFDETRDRVFSMALVHQTLYDVTNHSRIDMEYYLYDISSKLKGIYAPDRNIRIESNAKDISLDINRAIPIGLILNELITNALKHAFPDNREGSIALSISLKDASCHLTVMDNGIGLPEDIWIDKADTLGLELIRLLTKQIGGTLDIQRNHGTQFTITFPCVDTKE